MPDAQGSPDEATGAAKSEHPSPSPLAIERVRPTNRDLWVETAVVLLVVVVPDLFYAFSITWWWPQLSYERPFAYAALYYVVRASQVSGLIVYLIWRCADRWSHFGLVRPDWTIDVFFGLGIAFADFVVYYSFWFAIWLFMPKAYTNLILDDRVSAFFSRPQGLIEYSLLMVACFANAFAEELAMRGYLIHRFERLLGSTWKALLLSSTLFAAYHLYQGTAGLVSIFLSGLVYGGAFCLLRRLWPIVIAHAIADITGWLDVSNWLLQTL